MPVRVPMALVALMMLGSCTEPPVYALLGTSPVTLDGRQCVAERYSVTYSRLFELGVPESAITRDQGIQFKIVCGTTTSNCLLNQTLAACIAALERPADSGYSYRPPT